MKKFFSKLFDNSNYIAHLEKKLDKIEKDWNKLVKEKDELQESYDKMYSATYDDPVHIDWVAIEAFSIERMMLGNGMPATVIGWFRPDGSIGEWKLYCNALHHARLCEEFLEYVKTKKVNDD